ncbi:MAG TPA: AsmA-like C-terminal region-containing protein, partial [Clostridia bacterium]|nr:AsmA-like C-terminal region-containing protein [Clostridia bacterium]
FSITAPGAETPWGSVAGGRFTALMFPASNGLSRAELTLDAAQAETRWASITNFHLKIDLATTEEQTDLVSGALQLSASQASTPWCSASNTVVSVEWIHSVTNPIPLSGRANISCAGAHTRWASAGHVDLDLRLLTSTASASPSASLGWWTNVLPFQAEWTCRAKKLQAGQVVLAMASPSSARSGPHTIPSAEVVLDSATISGSWRAPELSIHELNTSLHNAALQAKARLNIDTRAAAASVATDVDARKLFPLLPESARRWLGQFTWQQPPQARAEASLIFPPWTGHDPDWRKDVLPTLNLDGEFQLHTNGTYRGLQVSAASSHFHFSNLRWHLPDLTVFRPEGRVIAEHRADEQSKDFYWRIDSTVDPAAVKPLLQPNAQRAFDLARFEMPPKIQGEIWGRSKAPERTCFKASVQLTNFSFRGQSASSLETRLTFTNKLLACIGPRITRTNQFASADALIVDLNAQKIYLTNGFSTMDPMVVAKAIGAGTARAIEPYTFRSPPTARVYGIIPMRGEEDANLHFDIQGEGFHWWKFNMESMSGHVHWAGERVFLKDVAADFYQGKATGFANFDFSKRRGTDFEFAATVTNALLQFLIADLSPGTNRLEGRLHGTVAVTSANTGDWRSVHGYGAAQLQDGLVWDIPLFGIVSPVLNSVSPGLGNSRATAANCTFSITNGVIRSDNLEFRAQAMRLQYRGTVDLENRLDARVEAELLRDMWIVGPLVSTVFWPVTKMFEYRVSGSLSQPVMEPVYLFPKIMMLPFHPLKTLKNLFPDDTSSRSNAPPGGR